MTSRNITKWGPLVLLFLLVSCGNRPPVAGDMIVSPVTVKAGSQATITVIASDADGDALAYYWSATRGSVPTDSVGPSIKYTAPMQGGIDTITVTITDGKSTTTNQISVSVEASDSGSIVTTEPSNSPATQEPTQTFSPTITNTPNIGVADPPPTSFPEVTPTFTAEFLPTIAPTPSIAETLGLPTPPIDNNITMILIPSGPFIMGADPESELQRCEAYYPVSGCQLSFFEDEAPVHLVQLSNYYIDLYEVTNGEYAKCVSAGECLPPYANSSAVRGSYYGNPQYSDYPVLHIDWYQAQTYCVWRGARLPTEAEWEKAARGTNENPYPWGTIRPEDSLLNFNQKIGDTVAVGSYPLGVSPYGIYDMAGNVSEWVADIYGNYPTGTETETNPTGETIGTRKVIRGGGWQSSGIHVSTTKRLWAETVVGNADYFYDVGFRCASTP